MYIYIIYMTYSSETDGILTCINRKDWVPHGKKHLAVVAANGARARPAAWPVRLVGRLGRNWDSSCFINWCMISGGCIDVPSGNLT